MQPEEAWISRLNRPLRLACSFYRIAQFRHAKAPGGQSVAFAAEIPCSLVTRLLRLVYQFQWLSRSV